MEQTEQQGDGINRPYGYASFRTDQEAVTGHSKELISNLINPKHFDDLGGVPYPPSDNEHDYDSETLLAAFKTNVVKWENEPFLGSRVKSENGELGAYQWQNYTEVN